MKKVEKKVEKRYFDQLPNISKIGQVDKKKRKR